MSSRSKWEDMVNTIGAGLDKLPKRTKTEEKPVEKKGLSVEDIPGDPGSTVGTIREYKKKQEKMLSDL